VKAGLKIVPVASLDELLKHALVRPLVPIEWSEEAAATQPVLPQPAAAEQPGVITH